MARGLGLVATATLFLARAAAATTGSGMLEGWVHPGADTLRQDGYHGARTCAGCHPDALTEVTGTVHWHVSTPIRNVQGLPDGSWWGMINRECALAGSLAIANWTAATNGRFTVQAAGCGACHVGSLPAPPLPPGTAATDAQASTVDCLVCHASRYDMKARETLVTGPAGARWGADTSLEAALSVTRAPTTEACLRCHEHAFSYDYKRGTPFTPQTDVHAKAGIGCVTCHPTEHHKMPKGQFESDMAANDLPDVKVLCAGCHGETPHRGKAGATLNAHVAVIACQTCHIPVVSGISYEDWGRPVRDDAHGRYSALSRYDEIPAIRGLYVPTVKITRGHPDYIWRVANTETREDVQSWMAFQVSSIKSAGAKIYPVRGLTQVLLFDRKLKMWQEPGMAFLKDSPHTAEFPAMLAPNREVYNRTGDVKAAIDAGMKPMEAMGFTWSGEWMGMRVPGTSYVSVNHAVKKAGLSCSQCHSARGVMDFRGLGYSPAQVRALEAPR